MYKQGWVIAYFSFLLGNVCREKEWREALKRQEKEKWKAKNRCEEKVIKYEKVLTLKRLREKRKNWEKCRTDTFAGLDLLSKRTFFAEKDNDWGSRIWDQKYLEIGSYKKVILIWQEYEILKCAQLTQFTVKLTLL